MYVGVHVDEELSQNDAGYGFNPGKFSVCTRRRARRYSDKSNLGLDGRRTSFRGDPKAKRSIVCEQRF